MRYGPANQTNYYTTELYTNFIKACQKISRESYAIYISMFTVYTYIYVYGKYIHKQYYQGLVPFKFLNPCRDIYRSVFFTTLILLAPWTPQGLGFGELYSNIRWVIQQIRLRIHNLLESAGAELPASWTAVLIHWQNLCEEPRFSFTAMKETSSLFSSTDSVVNQ
jgi:hypothetical protein